MMRQFSRMVQEQQAEDVGLVVAAVDRPAQDVGGRPEVLLELGDAQDLCGKVGGFRGNGVFGRHLSVSPPWAAHPTEGPRGSPLSSAKPMRSSIFRAKSLKSR